MSQNIHDFIIELCYVFSFSQDPLCPMLPLVSQLWPWSRECTLHPQISINIQETTTAGRLLSAPVPPDSLHDQTSPGWGRQPYPLVTAEVLTFNGKNQSAPLARMQQLLHQSHMAQSRTTWLFGTEKVGGKVFYCYHSKDLGGALMTWGSNSLLLFSEGNHPSAIHRPLCIRKKSLHKE